MPGTLPPSLLCTTHLVLSVTISMLPAEACLALQGACAAAAVADFS